MGHYVYKYVLNNEIIYIGKNDTDLHSRIRSHGRAGDNIPREAWKDINAAQVYYIELPNSTMSDVVESELIRRYQPKYNKAKKTSDWCGLPFAEPEWNEYVEEIKVDEKKKRRKDRHLERALEFSQRNLETLSVISYIVTRVIDGDFYFIDSKDEGDFGILVSPFALRMDIKMPPSFVKEREPHAIPNIPCGAVTNMKGFTGVNLSIVSCWSGDKLMGLEAYHLEELTRSIRRVFDVIKEHEMYLHDVMGKEIPTLLFEVEKQITEIEKQLSQIKFPEKSHL